jgi:hypothetical protein
LGNTRRAPEVPTPEAALRSVVSAFLNAFVKPITVLKTRSYGPKITSAAPSHGRTYVFTTGGIGPTHGDITADSMAKTFGMPIDTDPRALAILHDRVKTTGAEMNEARLRMTRTPKGGGSHPLAGCQGPWLLDRHCNRDGRRRR